MSCFFFFHFSSRQSVHHPKLPSPALCLSLTGTWILSGCADGAVRFADRRRPDRPVRTEADPPPSPVVAAFASDDAVATLDVEGRARFYRVAPPSSEADGGCHSLERCGGCQMTINPKRSNKPAFKSVTQKFHNSVTLASVFGLTFVVAIGHETSNPRLATLSRSEPRRWRIPAGSGGRR